ncbi:hypothetical protein Baya_15009 [Bagarius yarrelli]|uniref:Uncharacterized protein n=1 Tax=Bagarius yarrelli TaxID=175774 RepID=A0A556VAW8_BAGYA|nr:hypothetical protein Baya_15009 [Bagarius yarrelli]
MQPDSLGPAFDPPYSLVKVPDMGAEELIIGLRQVLIEFHAVWLKDIEVLSISPPVTMIVGDGGELDC